MPELEDGVLGAEGSGQCHLLFRAYSACAVFACNGLGCSGSQILHGFNNMHGLKTTISTDTFEILDGRPFELAPRE